MEEGKEEEEKKDSADKLFDFAFEVIVVAIVVGLIMLTIGTIGIFLFE